MERDRWERLRDLLTNPRGAPIPGPGNEPRWLVSGFAVCGVCGGRTRAGPGGRNRAAAYIGAGCCHVRRTARAVDDYIAGGEVTGGLSEPDAAGPAPARAAPRHRRRLRWPKRAGSGPARRPRCGCKPPATLTTPTSRPGCGLSGTGSPLIDSQLAASDEADPLAEFRDGQPAETVWGGTGNGPPPGGGANADRGGSDQAGPGGGARDSTRRRWISPGIRPATVAGIRNNCQYRDPFVQ